MIIGGDVDLSAHLDGEVLVADGVTGTDLGALGVEGNSQRAARLGASSLTGIVDDGLVVLDAKGQRTSTAFMESKILTSYEPWEKFIRTTLRPTTIPSVYLSKSNAMMIEGIAIPVRRALIFSTELVLGPGGRLSLARNSFPRG